MRRPCGLLAFALLVQGCQLIADLPDRSELCLVNSDCQAAGTLCRNGECITVDQAGCTPQCSNMECGPDGCGGFCGLCPDGKLCDQGRCAGSCRDGGDMCGPRSCDAETGLCRCSNDDQCASPSKCDAGSGQCVECLSGEECRGMPCVAGRCSRCDLDGECKSMFGGQRGVCEDARCLECRQDADCGAGTICEGGSCQAGQCASAGDPRCTSQHKKCDLSQASPRCVTCRDSADCPASQTCEQSVCVERSRCAGVTCDAPFVCDQGTGYCVRCLDSSQCGGGSLCELGECVGSGCRHDLDCRTAVTGLRCQVEHCGCEGNGDCSALKPYCQQGYGGIGTCVECRVSAECQHLGSRGYCDSAGNVCRCSPSPTCAAGLCGSVEDGCGNSMECGSCQLGQRCNDSHFCEAIPTSEGNPCLSDAECSTGDLVCFKPTFPGSDRMAYQRGFCARAATSYPGAGEVLVEGKLLAVCTSNTDCPAAGFCATSTQDLSVKYCLPGCRAGQADACPSGQGCDPYSHQCMSQTTSLPGRPCTPGAGACGPDETCLPAVSAESGTEAGLCARRCTQSSEANQCLCIPGITSGQGGCQKDRFGYPSSCKYDSDCPPPRLCAQDGSGAHCEMACNLNGGLTVSGQQCDSSLPCSPENRRWKDPAGYDLAYCREMSTIGQECSSPQDCGQGEDCRWFVGSRGSCVAFFTSDTECRSRCTTPGLACVREGMSGGAFCTKACSQPSQCGPGLTCSDGGCSSSCGNAALPCNPGRANEAYSCRDDDGNGLFECAPQTTAGGRPEGDYCAADGECRAGLVCASPNFADTLAPKRCRSSCPYGDVVCSSGTLCFPSSNAGGISYCAAPNGTGGNQASCHSADDCQSGLACLGAHMEGTTAVAGLCGAICRTDGVTPPALAPDCNCARLQPDATTSWSGGVCGQGGVPLSPLPDWCPTTAATTEIICDFCDDDRDGVVDEGLGSTSPSDLPASESLLGIEGRVREAQTIPLPEGGFLTVYLVEWDASWEVRVARHVPGQASAQWIRVTSRPRTGTDSLASGRRLSLVGPVSNAAPAVFYIASRFTSADPFILQRLSAEGDSLSLDGAYSRSLDARTLRLGQLAPRDGRLLALYEERQTPGSVKLFVLEHSTGQAWTTSVASVSGLVDLGIVPHPNGSGAALLLYATASGLHHQTATMTQGTAPTANGVSVMTSLTDTILSFRAASFTRAKRLLLVVETALELKSVVWNDSMPGAQIIGLGANRQGPYDLVVGVDQPVGSFGLLAHKDTSVLKPHLGGLSVATGELRAFQGLGSLAGTLEAVSLAFDGVRIGAAVHLSETGTRRSAFYAGCTQ